MKVFIKKYGLILFIILMAFIKLIMTANLPIYAIAPAAADDRLMITTADSLLNLEWLGQYNQYTLVKGMFFSLFLAVLNFIGISYTVGITLTYIISCIVFIVAIKDKIKSKWGLGFIYLLLLFNPVTFSNEAFLRVYRNSITPSQVLFIFSCFIAIYFKLGDTKYRKSIWVWTIGAGISLASLWHTREDAIWIMPFVAVLTIICIIKLILQLKKQDNIRKFVIKNLSIIATPIIIFMISNVVISTLNNHYYGIYSTNELNDSNFTKAMKSIYAVKPEQEIEYVSVTREKLERIYKYCPTMNELKEELDHGINVYKCADRHPEDNEVEDGWFFWSLREAVSKAGYYDQGAQAVNELYGKISQEIEKALDEGHLERQSVMPSALMAPWRKGHAEKLANTAGRIIEYVCNFEEITTSPIISVDDTIGGIYMFEALTNNKAIYPNTDYQGFEARVGNRYAKRLNIITKVYQKTGVLLAILGLVGYVYIIIKNIKGLKKKDYKEFDILVLLTGILGSFLVLVIGVSYNQIASCHSITYMYLSGAYPLLIAFETISICKIFEYIQSNLKKKQKYIDEKN